MDDNVSTISLVNASPTLVKRDLVSVPSRKVVFLARFDPITDVEDINFILTLIRYRVLN